MQKFFYGVLILFTFSLFSQEESSKIANNNHYLLNGQGNIKVGLNISYSRLQSKDTSELYWDTTSFAGTGKSMNYFNLNNINFIPYQPTTSGLFVSYGIFDNLQAFLSMDIYDIHGSNMFWISKRSDSSSGYEHIEFKETFGTPFLGVSYGLNFDNINILLSPYISVPFFEKSTKPERHFDGDFDNSFKQSIGYGIAVDFIIHIDNLFMNLLLNGYKVNEDDYSPEYSVYNSGIYAGYKINNENDFFKAGIITQKFTTYQHSSSSDYDTIFRLDLIYSLNFINNINLNFECWYGLPTEILEDSYLYGIAVQFLYKL